MKSILNFFLTIGAILLLSVPTTSFSQEAFNYQAVIRNAEGTPIAHETINLTIILREGSPVGNIIFEENHRVQTNEQGLINLQVGRGSPMLGELSEINWANGSIFIEVMRKDNGSNSKKSIGLAELLSVPYAMYAFKSGNLEGSVGSRSNLWSENNDDIYYNHGNVGIGNSSPAALLHTKGNGIGMGNIVHEGLRKYFFYDDVPVMGQGTRMMWYPDKAAFRAGHVNGNEWDTENIGIYSAALGQNTKASGDASIAMGRLTIASGNTSTAWGYQTIASAYKATAWGLGSVASGLESTSWGRYTTASGGQSTAWGLHTTASGSISTAWGEGSIASGKGSTAIGEGVKAPSYFQTTIGLFNTNYFPQRTWEWHALDRLFVIGNGTSNANRSDALVVLKNGRIGASVSNPQSDFHLIHANSGATGGFRLQNRSSNDHFRLYVASSDGNLRLYSNNHSSPVGNFNDNSGVYTATSDRRLKTDFEDLTFDWESFMKLKTLTYHYKSDESEKKHIGMIAQEVMEIYPDVITYLEDEDTYLMDYSAFGVIAIKAVQEQQKIINSLLEREEMTNMLLSEMSKEIQQLQQTFQSIELFKATAKK